MVTVGGYVSLNTQGVYLHKLLLSVMLHFIFVKFVCISFWTGGRREVEWDSRDGGH